MDNRLSANTFLKSSGLSLAALATCLEIFSTPWAGNYRGGRSQRDSFGMSQSSMCKVPSLQRVPMGRGQEVALVSAIVLETDVSSCNHAVESAPQPALEKSSGVRNQQYQSKKIREHSRYYQ